MVEPSRFEWRTPLGSWRWLILGAIGAGAACGGQAGSEPSSSSGAGGQGGAASGVNPVAVGGSAATTPARGATGLEGVLEASSAPQSPSDPTPSVCEDEVALEGGLRRCFNGAFHRPSAESCTVIDPLPELVADERVPGDPSKYACRHNADCTEKRLGQCTVEFGAPLCKYGCETDADCEVDQLCRCGGTAGYCEQASCRTDSDCLGTDLCASYNHCGSTRFVCTRGVDQCLVDSDCPGATGCLVASVTEINPLVASSGEYRKCSEYFASCPVPGRPFIVAGQARVAPAVASCDWYSPAEGEHAPSRLTPELRAELARGWTEQALMEHASIAAFARFTLQLLSLGAPAELVARSSEAMADEIRHAQDCFRLARRYSPSDLGPGPLPMAGALEATDLCEIVLSTLREGCIGETMAAIEAAEAFEHCADAEARPVLERIAAEETRHAELAWRFVAWALDTAAEPQRAELRRRICAALAQELTAPVSTAAVGELDGELARHGLLSSALRQALRARVLREVVAPCAEALLASAPAAAQQASLVDIDIERQRTAALKQSRISARQLIAG